ncbi:MAG: hypothetical protein ACOX3K_03055 [Bacilli bacterium]
MLITEIKVTKNKVTITLADNRKLILPVEVYAEHYLRVNDDLTVKKIETLIKQGERITLQNYALRCLVRRSHSVGEMREKLVAKQGKEEDIKAIISYLKDRHYLDDEQYLQDYLLRADDLGYGKHKILARLKKAKIAPSLLDRLIFPEEREYQKAEQLLPSLLRKYHNVDLGKRKERIYQSLLNSGFDYTTIHSLLSHRDFSDSEKDEELLRKATQKALSKYQTEKDQYLRRAKIIRYLRQRGYNYSDIERILEEEEDAY